MRRWRHPLSHKRQSVFEHKHSCTNPSDRFKLKLQPHEKYLLSYLAIRDAPKDTEVPYKHKIQWPHFTKTNLEWASPAELKRNAPESSGQHPAAFCHSKVSSGEGLQHCQHRNSGSCTGVGLHRKWSSRVYSARKAQLDLPAGEPEQASVRKKGKRKGEEKQKDKREKNPQTSQNPRQG